jgi:hypothetical protein
MSPVGVGDETMVVVGDQNVWGIATP